MLVAPRVSYPGVYIQEVESDVRTIVGVETSTTAFIGRAIRGPVDKPVVINSYADFEGTFGGLWLESSLGYAVHDFFQNGGVKAVVVRVFKQLTEDDTGRAKLAVKGLQLEAKDPGTWGNNLAGRITYITKDEVAKTVAERYGLDDPTLLFTLTVRDLKTGTTETFESVTVNKGPRQIKEVLKQESNLVQLSGEPPADRPNAHPEDYDHTNNQFKSVWDDPNTRDKEEPGSGNDGNPLDDDAVVGKQVNKTGLYALENADIFNLLCIPPYAGADVKEMSDVGGDILAKAVTYCEERRAILLIDPPKAWKKEEMRDGVPLQGIGAHKNAALYFPRIKKPNPLRDKQIEEFAPCGVVAGIIARTDATRGVWKAPAGLDATVRGVFELSVPLTDRENGELNPLGINCLRKMPPAGNVVWGARTTMGDDRLASQWKYIPVRRTALYIEETLFRSIQWAVFEPNDEPLWSQLRLNIGVFMHGLFRQGAFQGQSPQEAYSVQCDSTTTTQADIDKGTVNIVVGFAPLKPAEFVVIYIKQLAGQLAA